MLTTSAHGVPPSLSGHVIRSERQLGVYYELERCVGEGGMGRAYLARRKCAVGTAPVVVKVMHLDVAEGSVAPELLAMKEAVALGRLNEQVPPCPYVVRLVDAGNAGMQGSVATPWLALEYVHGGIEGTTLEDRVTYSLRRTGYGFDIARAAHVVRCLSTGLDAIHAVSVIHRDLSPGNVLCCGFGEAEILKIADFGVARPGGLDRTFVGLKVGTPGYMAPDAHDPAAGPATDVFALAAVVYYILTGQRYFLADQPTDALLEIASPTRRSITDHTTLVPELFNDPEACQGIDAALARATSISASQRIGTAHEFASTILPWLGGHEVAPRSSYRLLSAVASSRPAVALEYEWTVRSQPRDDIVISSAAWDTDGHALALSPVGGWFWDGQSWRDATRLLATVPGQPLFVRRHDAGGWLVGGAGPVVSIIDTSAVSTSLLAPIEDGRLTLASGRIGDLLAVVQHRDGAPPVLHCASRGRFLKPFVLEGAAQVTALQRVDETHWLVGGRLRDGGGFAAIYEPLACAVTTLATPPLRSFIAGTSAPDRALGILVGSEGAVLRLDGAKVSVSRVPGEPDLGAVGVDVTDQEWATSLGKIFSRDARTGEPWRLRWHDPAWHAPFVSLIADVGQVMAMTADGAILEGQCSQINGV